MNAIQLTGYLAAILTTVSFIPQALKTIRTKNTHGISLGMYIMFSTGVFCWLVYGIANEDIPIVIANAATLFFAMIILLFKIRYK